MSTTPQFAKDQKVLYALVNSQAGPSSWTDATIIDSHRDDPDPPYYTISYYKMEEVAPTGVPDMGSKGLGGVKKKKASTKLVKHEKQTTAGRLKARTE